MVPLRDRNPIKITPYVTYVLIGLNVAIFLYEINLSPPELEAFFQLFAVIPQELTLGFRGLSTNQPIPEWMTLFSAQFLHGGILHLGGNMLYLWVFGNNIEEVLGRFRFLIFYLACGVLASLASVVLLFSIGCSLFRRKWRDRRDYGCLCATLPPSGSSYSSPHFPVLDDDSRSCGFLFSRISENPPSTIFDLGGDESASIEGVQYP
ncbi:UNVERIFIED_CONTAM: hypothetical protein BEN50_16115 [Euhalothece sp. KZN 001]